MKAILHSLDGLTKEVTTTWPFPPQIFTPLIKPNIKEKDIAGMDPFFIRIRKYELDTRVSHCGQRFPAHYIEVWEK